MKKSFLFICAFAAAILLAGCQKEINNEEVDLVEATHSVVFTAEKIIDTRTAIASEGNGVVSYKWIEGDDTRVRIIESYLDGEETKTNTGTITQMTLTNDDKTATFNVTFSGDAPTGTIKYRAVYGSSISNSHNPLIPSDQNPLTDSFDPAADVMVSDEIVRTSRDANPTFRFNMNRKVSVNKMTLKGLTPGEVISSVSFGSDKYHSARYLISSGDYYTPDGGKKLTLTFTANNTVPSSGEFPVYFTTAPVTNATFTVTVVTDQHRYSKSSSKTISFAVGEVRRFGVDLAGCEQAEGRVFNLVTAASELQLGADVVIAANGVKNIAMSTTQNDNNRGTADATKSADRLTITITDQVQVFTLTQGTTSGTYAFSFDDNGTTKYLYAASSSKNWLRSQSTLDANASWTVSISSNEATITAQGENTRNILRYNSGDDIFSCYSSGQQTVYLYQASPLETVATPTFTPEGGNVSAGTLVTISTTTPGATIYYTTNGDTPTTSSSVYTSPIEITSTITIKAIAVKENYNNSAVATSTYTIPSSTTIADILADNTVTFDNLVHYEVSGVTVMARQGTNYIIGDATGVMLMYCNVSPALTVGNQYDVQGDVKLYHNVHEFASPTVQSSTGTAPEYGTPETMTVTSLTDYASHPITKYATFAMTAPENGSTTGTDGTHSIQIFDGTGTLSNYYNKSIIVTGYLVGYLSNKYYVLATAIEEDTSIPSLSVDPTSLSWEASESGADVAKTITVTRNGDATYTVSYTDTNHEWTVSDNHSGTITVYPNAANTSTTNPKTLTLTITHDVDANLNETVVCTQDMLVDLVTAIATFTGIESGGMTETAGSQTGIRRNVTAVVSNGLANVSENHIRIYKNATLTLSVPEGAYITSIEFTGISGNPVSNFGNMTGLTFDGNNGSWSGRVNSITFTASIAQVRLSAITVTYQIASGSLIYYVPTINAEDKAITVGQTISIGASSNSGGDISYSIQSGNSFITLNESTGTITGVAAGTTEIRVSVAASGDYSAGYKDINVVVSEGGGGDTEEEKTYTVTFTSNTEPNNSSYTSSFTVTIGSDTWTVTGFNNNNNGWSGLIKGGRKDYTSTGSISSDFAMPYTITKVKVTYGACIPSKITSAKLIIASDANFTQNKTETTITVTANSTQTYTISSPAKNMYYKLDFGFDKCSKNGDAVSISKVEYTNI